MATHEQHVEVKARYLKVRREAMKDFREKVLAAHPNAEFLPSGFAYRIGNRTVATGWTPKGENFTAEDMSILGDTVYCAECAGDTEAALAKAST